MPERPRPTTPPRVPYRPPRFDAEETVARGRRFHQTSSQRRSVRSFSPDAKVPYEAIEAAVRVAASAPSGANKQPWTFVVVDDPELKRAIRAEAEEQEQHFHAEVASAEFLEELTPLGIDWTKPFLEHAPYLIVVFAQSYERLADGSKGKHYYTSESVGIAVGMLIAALTEMGLCTLPYTPSPMGFLGRLLDRPPNERAFLVLPVGYPAADASVPDLRKKDLDQVLIRNAPALSQR